MRSLSGGRSDGKREWYEVLQAIELSITHETFFYEFKTPIVHSLLLFSYLGFNKAVYLLLSSSFRSLMAVR